MNTNTSPHPTLTTTGSKFKQTSRCMTTLQDELKAGMILKWMVESLDGPF